MLLAIAVALFAAIHLIPAVPALKQRLQARLGRKYGMSFGLASVVTLVLIILAWPITDRSPVYDPPQWGWTANLVLSFFAFLLVGVFIFRGRLRQKLRLPLAIGVACWAVGHLLANGDAASVILFAGLLLYAVLHLVLGLAQGFRPSADVRQGHDILSLFTGVALYGVMIQLHAHIIGVPLFSIHDLAGLAR